ncbi:MAG: 23S rRNA (uracil(1939)-C(5))-methyltransferase RlmD [Clostridiales bacterium]|nr:23S rRNA (uracil(1939)-C(5))-methyltransferase RlmD [Clostridiales bacterium]
MANLSACPVSKKCGGCQLQNMDYERQLRYKQSVAVKHLAKYGRVEQIIGMKNPTHYRNKVQAAFGKTRSGMIISGVYQSGTHNIVRVDECMIEDKKADEIIVSIRNMLKSFRMYPYDEDKRTGFLRHVLIKRGFKTGEIMVVIVGASPIFASKNNFVKALLKLHPEITTVIFNVNSADTNLVLGERESVLHGKGYIVDELCGCRFRISSRSFYQINPVQTEILYSKAMDFAQLDGTQTVIDAYCGIGTIGLVAATRAKSVLGVELNRDAVKDAKENAALNNAGNIRFICADAGDFMEEAASSQHTDVVFMDPPRAGSTQKFLSSLIKLSPEKIVYISCNPETLGRDLYYITGHSKYRVKKIQPVDMFPHTKHVETCVLLSHKNS